MSVRVLLEEINIWIGELNEANGLPQCEWESFNLVRVWMEQKEEG